MTIPFEISAVLGPLLVGLVLNAILYGICVIQCFIYYQTYKRDATWIRYFILYLFIMETVNTVCDVGIVFEPLILFFGDPIAYTKTPTMLILDAPITVMLSTPVQYFIAWRIKVVSGSWVMPLIIGFFSASSFIGGMAVGALSVVIRERAKLERVEPAVITWLASSATSDVLITLSLSLFLVKRKTGIKFTDKTITRIVFLTVQTGTITTLFSLADVIIFLTITRTNMLNARDGWGNLTGTTNSNADAAILFGKMTPRKSTHTTSVLSDDATVRTDIIDLDDAVSSDDQIKLATLESGIHVHRMVEQL